MDLRQETEGAANDNEPEENPIVEVREYLRCRLLRWETVRQHTRKWPRWGEAKSKDE